MSANSSTTAYKRVLSKGKQDNLPGIEKGMLRFTTDTGRIYLDFDDDKRVEFTDFVKDKTKDQILAIENPLPKVYLASDTHEMLVYDTISHQWVNYGGGSGGGLEAVDLTRAEYDALTPEQKADPTKLYLVDDNIEYLTTQDIQYNTTSGWASKSTLVSRLNTIYVYTDYKNKDNKNIPGFKVGDGVTQLINLPFSDDLANHAINADTATYAINASTAQYVVTATKAIYKSLDEYDALTPQEKIDPTKIYFVINEGTKASPTLEADDGNCDTTYDKNHAWWPLSGNPDAELPLFNGGLELHQNCWWSYHFDSRIQFSKVKFSVLDQGRGLWCYVQGSNDNSNWTNILINPYGYEEIASGKTKCEFPLNCNGVSYEYFRLYFIRTTYESGGVRLYGDTEVYASETSSRPLIYYKNILYTEYELPTVTVEDSGKALIVNNDGIWNAEVPPNDEVKQIETSSGGYAVVLSDRNQGPVYKNSGLTYDVNGGFGRVLYVESPEDLNADPQIWITKVFDRSASAFRTMSLSSYDITLDGISEQGEVKTQTWDGTNRSLKQSIRTMHLSGSITPTTEM